MSGIDAKTIASELARRAEAVVRHLLPHAVKAGGEMTAGDMSGSKGRSLSVRVTGDKAGVWSDFATGESGDLLDLWAASRCNGDLSQAMRDAQSWLGIAPPARQTDRPSPRAISEGGPKPAPRGSRPTCVAQAGKAVAAIYVYEDAQSRPFFAAVRYAPKGFRKCHYDGARWVPKGFPPNVRYPMFNLPGVLTTDRPILIVEGEKTAEAAACIVADVCATTFQGGAEAVSKTDWSPLAGRHVVIWPDADDAGRSAADAIAAEAARVGAISVRVVATFDLPSGWDLADRLPAGWTEETIAHRIAAAPDILALRQDELRLEDGILDLGALAESPPPPRDWIIADWLPKAHPTLFSAPGGAGKSLLALQLAMSVAQGKEFLGLPVAKGKVLAWMAEDDRHELHRRLDAIQPLTEVSQSDLANLLVVPRHGKDSLLVLPEHGRITFTSEWDRLVDQVDRYRPSLLIIDNAAQVYGCNENDRPATTQFLNKLGWLAMTYDCAVLLLAHPSKSDPISGSTAWVGSVRSTWVMSHDDQEDNPANRSLRILERRKSNFAEQGVQVKLRLHNLRFTVEGNPSGGFVDMLERKSRERQTQEAFLDALSEVSAQGGIVNDKHQGGNYAPRVFRRRTKACASFTVTELEAAMHTLFREQVIGLRPHGPPSDGLRMIVRLLC